jgi:hypothetical protein
MDFGGESRHRNRTARADIDRRTRADPIEQFTERGSWITERAIHGPERRQFGLIRGPLSSCTFRRWADWRPGAVVGVVHASEYRTGVLVETVLGEATL